MRRSGFSWAYGCVCAVSVTLLVAGCQDTKPSDEGAPGNHPAGTNYVYHVTDTNATGVLYEGRTNGVEGKAIHLLVLTNFTFTSTKTGRVYTNAIGLSWHTDCPQVHWLQFVWTEVFDATGHVTNVKLKGEGNRKSGTETDHQWYVDTKPGASTPYYDDNAGHSADHHDLYDAPSAEQLIGHDEVSKVIKHFQTYCLCGSTIIFSVKWDTIFTKNPYQKAYVLAGPIVPGEKLTPDQSELKAVEPPPDSKWKCDPGWK
jgi:hypothetical protein